MTDPPSVAAWHEEKERKARLKASYWAAASGAALGFLLLIGSLLWVMISAFLSGLQGHSYSPNLFLFSLMFLGVLLGGICSAVRDDIVSRIKAF